MSEGYLRSCPLSKKFSQDLGDVSWSYFVPRHWEVDPRSGEKFWYATPGAKFWIRLLSIIKILWILSVIQDTFSLVDSSHTSVQFSSIGQSCPTLCDPMNCSTPGLPVHHRLPEFTQTHVHRVSDAIQPSHPLSSPSPPAPNPSPHQSLFQWVNSSHQVAKVLESQL